MVERTENRFKLKFPLLASRFWLLTTPLGIHAGTPAQVETAMKKAVKFRPFLFVLLVASIAPARGEAVRLEELNVGLMTSGWGTPQIGKDVQDRPMRIAGHLYAHGVGTHAPSVGVVLLDGLAGRFEASVGVTDGLPEGGSVEFIVSGDDKVLFDSGVMRGGQPAKLVDVPLTGVRVLKLEVTDGGDGVNSDHANWADAEISFLGKRPEMIDPNAPFSPESLYPPKDKLVTSPGNTSYYIDPLNGDDANPAGKPWKSFARMNAIALGRQVTRW